MNRWIILGAVAGALLLAAGALFTAWRSQWAERRFPPEGRFFDHPQTQLHYTDRGEGPVLVLLHGASTNLRDFFAIEPSLTRQFRVIAIDRPGSGYSSYRQRQWLDPAEQADIVLALLQSLQIERSVWVGHSLAGAVVMAGLLTNPRQVQGGVLLAGAVHSWKSGVDFIDHLPGVPVIGPLASHALVAPAGHMALTAGLDKAFAPDTPTAQYRERSGIDLYLRPLQFAATARDIRRLSDFLDGQARSYEQIRQPLLMIHGDADDIVPAWNHADRLILLRPDARYHRIAGGGHQPHHVHPGDVATWIEDFVRDVLPR